MSTTGLVDGRVALVTGAGAGIGRATATLLAREGAAAVVVSDIDEAKAVETAEMVTAEGCEGVAFAADVSDRSQVEALIALAIERFGRLDCAVNNAGVFGRTSTLAEMDDDLWRFVLGVNLDGTLNCLRAEINAMKGNDGAAIVNLSSGTTARPRVGLGAYIASKFGVLGLTRVAAAELATSGIRVNAVLPGPTRTEMIDSYLGTSPEIESTLLASVPRGELGRPVEIAEAIVWLVSPRSSFVNGTSLLVEGGMHSFAKE